MLNSGNSILRLLPNSLFGRMVLILIAGLIAAQIFSVAIVFQDRQHSQMQGRVTRSVQRAADLVHALDSLEPANRAQVIQAFNSRRFSVKESGAAFVLPQSDPDLADEAEDFSRALRQSIGGKHKIAAAIHYISDETDSGTQNTPAVSPDWLTRPDLLIVTEVALSDGRMVVIRQAFPGEQRQWIYRMLADFALRSAVVIAILLIAVRWATQPLSRLAIAAEKLGENINRPALAENGPAEVARAARAFNRMQARLAAFLKERAQALAAMSHDLKTPITRLRLRSELLDDGALRGKFEKDLLEMESMVQSTLDFMRGVGHEEPMQPIDVMALLESLEGDYSDMGRAVKIEGNVTSPFIGKARTLKRCLENLITNAVDYGTRARVFAERSGNNLMLRVEDDGPGIPESELERVFEPFYRLESSRNRANGGTGLGLSIARNIVQDHGGTIVCKNRPSGGLEVVVTLPVSSEFQSA